MVSLNNLCGRNIGIYGYSNLGRNAFNRLRAIYGDRVKGICVTAAIIKKRYQLEIPCSEKEEEVKKCL